MIVEIDYTNHRGERRLRKIKPINCEISSNKYHPKLCWMWNAKDVEDNNIVKTFPVSNIHSWRELND